MRNIALSLVFGVIVIFGSVSNSENSFALTIFERIEEDKKQIMLRQEKWREWGFTAVSQNRFRYEEHVREAMIDRFENNPDLLRVFQITIKQVDSKYILAVTGTTDSLYFIHNRENRYTVIFIGLEASDEAIIKFLCGENPCKE